MIQIFSKAGLLGRLISKCKINNWLSSLCSTHPPAISVKYILKEVAALTANLQCPSSTTVYGRRFSFKLISEFLKTNFPSFMDSNVTVSWSMQYLFTHWNTLSSNRVEYLRLWHGNIFSLLLCFLPIFKKSMQSKSENVLLHTYDFYFLLDCLANSLTSEGDPEGRFFKNT